MSTTQINKGAIITYILATMLSGLLLYVGYKVSINNTSSKVPINNTSSKVPVVVIIVLIIAIYITLVVIQFGYPDSRIGKLLFS